MVLKPADRLFAPLLPPPTRIHCSRAAAQKEGWENIKFSWCYSFLLAIFFNELAAFISCTRSVELQPTHRLLRRHCHHPLTFISAERQHNRKGEKTSSFDNGTVFYSPCLQLNCFFHFLSAICSIEAHRLFLVPLFLPPACISSNIAATQKEGWENITFWQCCNIFTHHFFNDILFFNPVTLFL